MLAVIVAFQMLQHDVGTSLHLEYAWLISSSKLDAQDLFPSPLSHVWSLSPKKLLTCKPTFGRPQWILKAE